MTEKKFDARNMIIPVTRDEYERFLKEDTFLPDCIHLRANELPDCDENCPEGLRCAMFSYTDPELDLQFEWHACATEEQLTQLWKRAVPSPTNRGERRVKFVAYQID